MKNSDKPVHNSVSGVRENPSKLHHTTAIKTFKIIHHQCPQMILPPIITFTLWLLAASNNDSRRSSPPRRGRDGGTETDGSRLGRHRYDRSGQKRATTTTSSRPPVKKGSGSKQQPDVDTIRFPKPTGLNGIRPTYFTCRHTYEEILIKEIQETFGKVKLSSPAPGLVECLESNLVPAFFDPAYALQSLPECVVVSADSIKGVSDAIHDEFP